jgi:glycosyltransferase involved in cell wall biosynthesis
MASMGMVSTIIPVYNAGVRVRQAVESAVGLGEVAEVLIVEDGSSDESLDSCRALAAGNTKVRLLRHPRGKNLGAGASRNLGALQARNEFIAFLDADDRYLPNRFDVDVPILRKDPSIDGVYGATGNEYESEEVKRLWVQQKRPEVATLTSAVPPEELIFALFGVHATSGGEFHTDAVTLRRQTFIKSGGFHTGLRLQQDTHLWHRLAASTRLVPGEISEPIAIRTVHRGNRMTKLEDHEAYFDLWWSSLGKSLREMNSSFRVMQAWRMAYARFRASRGERRQAILALAEWSFREPSVLLAAYGHFDLTLRDAFAHESWIIRALSAKNRLVRLVSRS